MLRLTRAHRRLLGPLLSASMGEGRLPESLTATEDLRLYPKARHFFQLHLASPGAWRGGYLIGRADGRVLHVDLALPAGYPWWATRDVVAGDARYLLGMLDALALVHSTFLADGWDWVGHWLIAPDNAAPHPDTVEQIITDGKRHGLFGQGEALLTVWAEDGRVRYDAWSTREWGNDPFEVITEGAVTPPSPSEEGSEPEEGPA